MYQNYGKKVENLTKSNKSGKKIWQAKVTKLSAKKIETQKKIQKIILRKSTYKKQKQLQNDVKKKEDNTATTQNNFYFAQALFS